MTNKQITILRIVLIIENTHKKIIQRKCNRLTKKMQRIRKSLKITLEIQEDQSHQWIIKEIIRIRMQIIKLKWNSSKIKTINNLGGKTTRHSRMDW